MSFTLSSKLSCATASAKAHRTKVRRSEVTHRSRTIVVKAEADGAEPVPPPAPKFCGGLAGNTGPFGDFDPAGFLNDKSENTIKRYREAEVTHGRVSMLASLGILVGENFNPLFDGKITGPAIDHFQKVPFPFWFALLGAITAAELKRASVGWVNPAGQDTEPGADTLFTLNDDYTPGDIGYDPLGLKPTNAGELLEMQNKEINNGRLAMIGTAGMIVQELVSHEKIL